MNNQSKKTEKLEPQDSKQKNIRRGNDEEAVVKPEDKVYRKKEANFPDAAKKVEQREQPVYPVKKAPEE